ncbi:MAG: hypothetical protein LWX56_14160 [Ignavibacteria bacterium]|nr:hypothetical protein [Ignavibacteria bacterium]
MNKIIRITIIGGCFVEQKDICRQDLYYNHMQDFLQKKLGYDCAITTIRYFDYHDCAGIVQKGILENNPHIVIFHTRFESIINHIKLYQQSQLNSETNSSAFIIRGKTIFQKMTTTAISTGNTVHPGRLHGLLSECNYIAGAMLGNLATCCSGYISELRTILNLCNEAGVQVLFTGPIPRYTSSMENLFSWYLSRLFNKNKDIATCYLPFYTFIQMNNKLHFAEDHKSLTKAAHRRLGIFIAENLLPAILQIDRLNQ